MLTAFRTIIGQTRVALSKRQAQEQEREEATKAKVLDTLTAIRLIDMAGLGTLD